MDKRIVFTAAIMDMLHSGHLKLLRNLRKAGKKVYVVLHDDYSCYLIKGKFPIQPIEQRVKQVEMTGLVDKVLVTKRTNPSDKFAEIYKENNPKELLFIRGDDNLKPPGWEFLHEKNIEQKYLPYTEGVSSSQIREELCNS